MNVVFCVGLNSSDAKALKKESDTIATVILKIKAITRI